MVFNATFSFIGGGNRSIRKNDRPAESHCQTLTLNVVSSAPSRSGRDSNSQRY
jgi:hypothetical protein